MSRVVCLCGSLRFRPEFTRAGRELTLAGHLVFAPAFTDDPTPPTAEQLAVLDAVHREKIRRSDEVYVINPGGYIGSSTASEIAYAHDLGRPVRYLVNPETQP